MDLWDMLKVAVRRWRVLVPLLALTVAATVLVGGRIDPEYAASGSLLLVGPSTTAAEAPAPGGQPGGATTAPPAQVNPYLSFPTSLPVTAQALGLRLNSAQTKSAMAENGLSTSYEITANERSPILTVEARAKDPGIAVGTLNRLIDVAGEDLQAIQETRDAPASQLVAVEVLDQNTDAARDSGTLNRVRLMVLGLGLAGSVAAAYATEGFAAWRRQRRRERPGRHSGQTRKRRRGGPATVDEPSDAPPAGGDRWDHVPAAAVPVPGPGEYEPAEVRTDGHWVTERT